jgi:hypothetical protein
MTLETGDVWPESVDSAPLEGTVLSGLESFCRLFEAAVDVGSRFDGAVGFSLILLEKSEMVMSAEAESMRLDGPWTATSSTPHL